MKSRGGAGRAAQRSIRCVSECHEHEQNHRLQAVCVSRSKHAYTVLHSNKNGKSRPLDLFIWKVGCFSGYKKEKHGLAALINIDAWSTIIYCTTVVVLMAINQEIYVNHNYVKALNYHI